VRPLAGLPDGEGRVRRARPPVLIVATSPGCLARVGGLPLVVRAVLTLRAAGFTDVAIVAGAQTGQVTAVLARRGAEAAVNWVGGSETWVGDPETAGEEPVLVLSGDVLFEPGALAPLLGRVDPAAGPIVAAISKGGGETHAAVCPASLLPLLVPRLADGAPLARALESVEAPPAAAVASGPGRFLPLDATHPPRRLTRTLLADLGRRTAKTDGYLAARLDRPVSRLLSGVVVDWPVTPNHITLAGIVLGLAGALMLSTVSYGWRLGGVLSLLASSILDGVDGEVARARFETSPAGARLDLMGDYVTHLATFLGLAAGLARQGLPWWVLSAAAAVGGVGASMALMHTWSVQPTLVATGDLHGSVAGTRPSLAERLAGRDYVYLLLFLASIGHLEWFLYAAAVGSWAFVLGLVGSAAVRKRRAVGPATVG
jgi:1L-myo-inositol 1-phosphate cytidylyltransferase / CDP-L-myo-inositol myo-inositolphosphotransferase